jgi:transcriptional regulator with XRE-family HTH domain
VLRAERGLSLTEASNLAGITIGTLTALEHGERGAYTSTLYKIAEAYGVDLRDLLGEFALVPAGKAEAPQETWRPSVPKPYARIPYGPGERRGDCVRARAEARRIIEEAIEDGEIGDPSGVVYHFTDDAIVLERLSDAEKDPVYGPWAEFARRYAERWHKKIEERDFDRSEFNEFVATVGDFTEIQGRLGRREKLERPYYDETFGPVMSWSIRLINDLFNPMAEAYAEMFGEGEETIEQNDELAAYRRRRAERERLANTPTGRTLNG